MSPDRPGRRNWVECSVSDPKRQDLGPNDPLYYVSRRLRERGNGSDPVPLAPATDIADRSAQPKPDENIAHLRPVGDRDPAVAKPDIFAEAVAKVLQEQVEAGPAKAPSVEPEPIRLGNLRDNEDWSARLQPDENIAHLRPVGDRDPRAQKQPDVFAEAVAKAMQAQLEPEFVEAPFVLRNRRSFSLVTSLAIAAGGAALAALLFVFVFPSSQGPAQDVASSTLQSLKSALFPAPQRKPAPTLVVRDNSGPVNEPLSLGVSVNSAAAGTTVIIDKMPATARLTVGRRMSSSEWHVPAQEIWDASIIPPTDFVGVMNLTAELRSDGTALVSSFVHLTWTSASAGSIVELAANAAATAPSRPVAPAPQQQQQQQQPVVSLAPAPAPAAVPTAPATRSEPIRAMNPDEVEGLIRRAQEMLTNGDLQAARLLLLRAAEAHDARAALSLAKTFDPMLAKQLGNPEPDLAEARNWYQRAREWGAPEAQDPLDALASYTR